MNGPKRILHLLWEIIWPYEIRWKAKKPTPTRYDGARLQELPRQRPDPAKVSPAITRQDRAAS